MNLESETHWKHFSETKVSGAFLQTPVLRAPHPQVHPGRTGSAAGVTGRSSGNPLLSSRADGPDTTNRLVLPDWSCTVNRTYVKFCYFLAEISKALPKKHTGNLNRQNNWLTVKITKKPQGAR